MVKKNKYKFTVDIPFIAPHRDSCIACQTSCHYECLSLNNNQCCCFEEEAANADNNEQLLSASEPSVKSNGRSLKSSTAVTDPKSTGRKRAAIAFPITEGMACEWTGLKSAGGGEFPITGCFGFPAEHRHHGPDKNTLNNVIGNVHRICTHCHNRWHAKNNRTYDDYLLSVGGPENVTPHDSSTMATPEELVQYHNSWSGK